MRSAKLAVAAIAVAAILPDVPEATAADGFDLVVLGALGGIQDGNLSASLIHPHGDNRGVTCDAGTLVNGLREAFDLPGTPIRVSLRMGQNPFDKERK